MISDVQTKCVGLIEMMKQNDEKSDTLGPSVSAPVITLMEFLTLHPDQIKSSQFVEVPIVSPFLLISDI